MCVRALRITVLKSAGNFTRDQCHDLSAEKIQCVNVLSSRSAEFAACQQFSNAGAAGWVRKFQAVVNWRKWLVYFAMSGLPPNNRTSSEPDRMSQTCRGRHSSLPYSSRARGTLFDRRVHSNYRRARSRRPLPRCFDGKSIASLISSLRLVFVCSDVELFQLPVYRLL